MNKPKILILTPSNFNTIVFKHITEYELKFQPVSISYSAYEIINNILQKNQTINGICAFADVSSIIASCIAEKLRLPGPSLESVIHAQYKPDFIQLANHSIPDFPQHIIYTGQKIPQSFPFPAFMRPAKGKLSMFAYRVENATEMKNNYMRAQLSEQKEIRWYNNFFKTFFPKKIFNLESFVVQPFIDAPQYTVDGFVFDGEFEIIGITKSIMTPDKKSFARFDHPAVLTKHITNKLRQTIKMTTAALKYNNAFFNMEFFVQNEEIIPIEWNTRVSLQFIPLFNVWYEENYFQNILKLSLGEKPTFTKKRYAKPASSYVLRTKNDYTITKLPGEKHIEKLKQKFPIISIQFLAKTESRLSDYTQDAYSYRYAIINVEENPDKKINQTLTEISQELGILMEPI